jgi:serine/threonine-protein kinase
VIGTTLNQRFTLEKELGRGGMGAVYRATDQVLQRSVAIKVLKEQGNDEVNRRIRLEAQILARLLHENVVRIYDFGEAGGMCFLVMEEVDGTSYSKRWRNLVLLQRLQVLAQVAEALDYAHHQGVIHRDMKPGNVLMTSGDQPKLSDFGLSMLAENTEDSATIRGTPHYMSPEQARGQRLDYRTDLYSLGVMLYENAAGSVPFAGKSMSVIAQHINQDPEPPRLRNPDVSPTLEALVLDLLAKNPDRRPPSGAEVARRLREEVERSMAHHVEPTAEIAAVGDLRSLGDGAGESTQAAVREAPTPSGPVLLTSTTPKAAPPLAREMLDEILAEPIALTPDERYLCGHYLAYLLGGSRRKGLLLRRPLDPRNADRARLLLAMTSVVIAGGTEASIARAAKLLEERPDVRPLLSPIVVAKYLAGRDTPPRRKKFRQARKHLQEASPYAQAHLVDSNGVLNPGLMPATLDDLRRVAPERTEIDDELVARWNHVADVWRGDADFRNAVLRYATKDAARNPASFELWPEVVYPLIERVRWQRHSRTRAEALWDNVCARFLRVPDAGVRLDRAFSKAVPAQVVEELDAALDAFEDEPDLDAELGPADSHAEGTDRLTVAAGRGKVNLDALIEDVDTRDKGLVTLAAPDPHRFTLGDLRELWQEAIASMRASKAAKTGHRHVPVGPYRLTVIPSVRGRSAGQVAIQGMPNKQIEMLTPSIRMGGSGSKPIVAVWLYQDSSLAIAYLGFKGSDSYILWHAPNAQQFNFDDPGSLNHMLYSLGMEIPDQLDRVLSKRFRPRNPV